MKSAFDRRRDEFIHEKQKSEVAKLKIKCIGSVVRLGVTASTYNVNAYGDGKTPATLECFCKIFEADKKEFMENVIKLNTLADVDEDIIQEIINWKFGDYGTPNEAKTKVDKITKYIASINMAQ